MKQDWLKDIHDRMADFEVDVPQGRDQREQPQGLWEDICSAEAEAATEVSAASVRKSYRMWPVGIAVAAACMLVVWLVHSGLVQDSGSTLIPTEQNVVAIGSAESGLPKVDNSIAQIAGHSQSDVHANDCIPQKVPTATEQCDVSDLVLIAEDSLSSDSIVRKIPAEHGFRREESAGETSSKRYEYLAHSDRKRASESRLTMGVSASGGIGSDNQQRFSGGHLAAASAMGESDWMDSPLLGIMAFNRGAETEKKSSHHSPFRVGLSFSYKLSDRWSLESGVSYALIRSDIREGSTANYVDENQKLQYVGIPIGVSYRLFSLKRLDMYVSSNVLAEQCVYGQSIRKYFLGDKQLGDDEANAIKARPVQVSLGAKVGAQYNLNSQLSVYVEPELRYYFDDRSSLETVFKEKPLDFNLNLGLRFTVGNR